MAYRPLDETTVVEFIAQRPSMANIFSRFDALTVSEVGDGNLNLVFIIDNDEAPDESAILKQALPYLRVAGDSWPLTRERMRYETQALLKHNELAPGLVPEVYDFDEEMSLVIMENLLEHEIMRKGLVARKRYPQFADHISTFLVNSLFFTSDLYLTGPEKKLGRGVTNVTEFARLGEMRRSVEQKALFSGVPSSYTTGVIHGFNRSVLRTLVGAYEIVTFPIPIPNYDPVLKPDNRLAPGMSVDPAFPDSYGPGRWAQSTFDTDTALGFSGGDVAPFIPGSRFHIFGY